MGCLLSKRTKYKRYNSDDIPPMSHYIERYNDKPIDDNPKTLKRKFTQYWNIVNAPINFYSQGHDILCSDSDDE